MKVHPKTIEKLGTAIDLIDDTQFAPMFRNRQINHPELFAFSEQLARRKKTPNFYFRYIWSKKNLKKTIAWLTKLVNQAKAKAAAAINRERQIKRESAPVNPKGLEKLATLKRSFNLIS